MTYRISGHAEAASHIQQQEGCAAITSNYLLWFWGKNKVSVKVTGRSSDRVMGKFRVGLELGLWLW